MSSLLQFNGVFSDRGVGLEFYLIEKGPDWEKYNGPGAHNPSPESTTFCVDAEPVRLANPKSGLISLVPQLYRVWRKPCGMWGNWVVFRYNGGEHLPDLSVPIGVFKLPRGAVKLTEEEMIRSWF